MPTLTLDTKNGARSLPYQVWDGRRLRSTRECPLALDTETERITDELHIPALALAVASDGKTHVVIHPDRLGDFLLTHGEEAFVGHNVQFDFWVIDRHFAGRGDERPRRILWDVCDRGRLFDTQILDMLLQLATGRFRKVAGAGGPRRTSKSEDMTVYPGNLAEVAADYTTLRVSKDDPYRLRFGELVGLGERDWDQVDPGFFHYAVRDAVVTRRLYPALAAAAYQAMTAYGFDRKAQRYEIRPDALEKFGYLSEIIQVQASIALAYLFRRGVRVNLEKSRALEDKYRSEMAEIVATLERDYSQVLTYGKDGALKLTPKGKTPSLGAKKLEPMLLRVVDELNSTGHAIETPTSDGKKKGMSLSVKAWGRYARLHPFLDLWARTAKLKKLLEFLAGLTAPVLHCQYSLLKRTGRTSCSRPRSDALPGLNVQQMPRLPEFRALFVPDPGCELFVGDFAAAELRTLAAACRARFGSSKLGDVITQKIDPHAFTAAAIQGMKLEDFQELKNTDPKRHKEGRQRSKPINFGVPGGMGAKALAAYALANYGVTLSLEEAGQFRTKLITEIYPELNDKDGYLADVSMATLARNLGVTEREVWEVFDRSGQRNPLAARGVAKVIRGASTASEYYQARVWADLHGLARTVRNLNPEVAELIAGEQGGRRLHDLLYHQSVATLTGRLRAGVGYTDSKNTPFQSLCADGAKLALWGLLYAGHDLYAFIHDETLVQVPADDAERHAAAIKEIKIKSMEEVMGHGIPAECDYVVADCWTKP
jgi:hypothetical protein